MSVSGGEAFGGNGGRRSIAGHFRQADPVGTPPSPASTAEVGRFPSMMIARSVKRTGESPLVQAHRVAAMQCCKGLYAGPSAVRLPDRSPAGDRKSQKDAGRFPVVTALFPQRRREPVTGAPPGKWIAGGANGRSARQPTVVGSAKNSRQGVRRDRKCRAALPRPERMH